jgi:Tol biopolymer transport system component
LRTLTGDKDSWLVTNRSVAKIQGTRQSLWCMWGTRDRHAFQRTVAVRPAAGGDEQLLADPLNANVLPFGWSPDGRSLLVSSNLSTLSTGRSMAVALWPMAAAPHADKAERVVASNPDYDLWQESFSPSGRWIVFEAVNRRPPDATATLYVIPSAGGWMRTDRIDRPHAWADKPRWSPDGRLLYFWLHTDPA